MRACGGFGCWWPLFLSVVVTLPQLIESGASLPPTRPVEDQGFILNKESPKRTKNVKPDCVSEGGKVAESPAFLA